MAGMILAKKFPKITQSLFLRSSSSSTQKLLLTKKKKNKDTGRRSVADKAKQGSYKASKSSVQNVKVGKTKDVAGKTDEQAKEKQKHWNKPPEGCHVLSTDASDRKGIAGIGGLIRDNNGFIVAAFAARTPIAPTHVIEIKAIVKGVELAMSTDGVTKLIIYSDSMTAVDLINGRLKTPRGAARDLILLNSMKCFFSRFEVRHVCRKANRPADFLASFCKSEGSSLVFNSVNTPKQLKLLAAQDICNQVQY